MGGSVRPSAAPAVSALAAGAVDNPGPNNPPPPSPGNPLINNSQLYSASMAALTMLFVIAVLLENAYAVIFSWRVFLTYFSLPGVKTIIMVVSSLIIVWTFKIDVVSNLIAVYKTTPGNPAQPVSNGFTVFITALILAGGSAGINQIMTSLGFRSDRQQDITPKPPANKAWISVRVTRKDAVSEIFVKVKDLGPADAAAPSPIAGVVSFRRPPLAGLLFPDVHRFPENGGYTVSPDRVYAISAESKNGQGADIKALDTEHYVFAAGAIVDFFVTL